MHTPNKENRLSNLNSTFHTTAQLLDPCPQWDPCLEWSCAMELTAMEATPIHCGFRFLSSRRGQVLGQVPQMTILDHVGLSLRGTMELSESNERLGDQKPRRAGGAWTACGPFSWPSPFTCKVGPQWDERDSKRFKPQKSYLSQLEPIFINFGIKEGC